MANSFRVVVLGCGKIGKLVCHMLATCGDYLVTAADFSIDQAHAVTALLPPESKNNVRAAQVNFTDENSLSDLLSGHDFVLSCAPYHCNVLIARVAKNVGVSYFDLTEDVATTKAVKELAKDSSLCFMPQCGLAPGFISIAAADLARTFDKIDAIKMRVGALPLYPHNRLKYNLTWSTEGLINEYGNPCEAISDGQLILVPPLEGHETFCWDGVEYEAFNTSGGLGTLCDSFAGQVQSLDYKSVRYLGHREIICLLMNDLKLNSDRATLAHIFERALPHTKQDIVLIFVTVTGWKDNIYSQRAYAKKVYHRNIGGFDWGAIQITTASGLCAALDLVANKKISQTGFIRQEDIPFDIFIENRFGRHYHSV